MFKARPILFLLLVFFSAGALYAQQSVPSLGQVVVVALENQSYGDVVGSSSMPYLNSLINRYAVAGKYYGNIHGSFPNYAMVVSGELITQAGWGLPNDFPISIDNIERQLIQAHKSWRVYAESLPSSGYTGGDSYPYVKRHNPFAYISDNLNGSSQAGNIQPLTQFAHDLAADTLPSFSFLVPNVEHDAEDCPSGGTNCVNADKLVAADHWLQSNIDPLLSSPSFQNDGLLVIWWDEGKASDTSFGGGQLAVVLAGPKVKPGYKSTIFYRHENLLRTIAEGLGIGFPGASLYVQSMSDFFGAGAAPGSITGHVTDGSSGAALAGATVSYNGGSTTTDNNGAYSFSNVPAGSYSLTASLSGYSSQSSTTTVTSGSTSTLDFQLAPAAPGGNGTLTGRVTNASSGAGISGATVSFSGRSSTTSSTGAYSFSNVPAGTYTVSVTHSGYIGESASATVNSGATSTLNVQLATAGKVAGKVTTSAGAAISGASIHLVGGVVSTTADTKSSSTGSYSSNWIPVGTYSVTVSASGHATQTKSVTVSTGNTASLNFTLQ
jgi:phosphatidylinositol-3-phosphatase